MTEIEKDEQAARNKKIEAAPELEYDPHGTLTTEEKPSYPGSLLGSAVLRGRGNGVINAAVIQNMQRAYGNRAVQRLVGSKTVASGKGSSSESPVSVQREPVSAVTGSPAVISPEVGSPLVPAGGAIRQ